MGGLESVAYGINNQGHVVGDVRMNQPPPISKKLPEMNLYLPLIVR